MLTDKTKALTLKEKEFKLVKGDYNWNNNLLSKANDEISSLQTELRETKNNLVLAEKKLEETISILATTESDLARTKSDLATTKSDLEIVRSKEKTLSDYIRNKPWEKPLDFTNSENQAYRDTSTLMQNMKEDVLRLTKTQKKNYGQRKK